MKKLSAGLHEAPVMVQILDYGVEKLPCSCVNPERGCLPAGGVSWHMSSAPSTRPGVGVRWLWGRSKKFGWGPKSPFPCVAENFWTAWFGEAAAVRKLPSPIFYSRQRPLAAYTVVFCDRRLLASCNATTMPHSEIDHPSTKRQKRDAIVKAQPSSKRSGSAIFAPFRVRITQPQKTMQIRDGNNSDSPESCRPLV